MRRQWQDRMRARGRRGGGGGAAAGGNLRALQRPRELRVGAGVDAGDMHGAHSAPSAERRLVLARLQRARERLIVGRRRRASHGAAP